MLSRIPIGFEYATFLSLINSYRCFHVQTSSHSRATKPTGLALISVSLALSSQLSSVHSAITLETLSSRRDGLSRGFFLDIARPSSCLHCLLPAPRDESVISRLRTSAKFPRVYTRTKRYCSFINYALNNYQPTT